MCHSLLGVSSDNFETHLHTQMNVARMRGAIAEQGFDEVSMSFGSIRKATLIDALKILNELRYGTDRDYRVC